MTYRRYEAIKNIMEAVTDELVVCNIGSPCKELFEIKDREENFYMLGSLGLASSIGLGMAMSAKDRKTIVIDGDGGILMNLGSLVTIANVEPKNLILMIIDNGSYGSTGFQKTFTHKDYGKSCIKKMAAAAGIMATDFVDGTTGEEVINAVKKTLAEEGPALLVIRTEEGEPPTKLIPVSSIEIKERFMDSIDSKRG